MKTLYTFTLGLLLLFCSITSINAQTTHTKIATDDVWLLDEASGYDTPSDDPLLHLRDMGNASGIEEVVYLKFDLSGLSGTLTDVKLRLDRHSGSDGINLEVFVATMGNLNWDENTSFGTTNNVSNAPGVGGNLTSVASSASLSNGVFEWTLTASTIATYLGGDLTLVLKKNGTMGSRVKLGSKDATATDDSDAPRLELTISGGGGNTSPMADFTSTSNGLTVDFMDASSDPDNGDVLTYDWDFGDGSSSTQQNPIHTYASANTYSVTLTVDDSNGGTDSETKSVTVTSGSGGTGAWSQSPSNSNNIFYDTGNVGIGIDNPIEMLHVAGEIYAVKVRVSTDAGADFVFEEGYQLMTLEEVEAYIKKHKHLPEIPSEQEMIENDLQLGDFSIKLLQKVEELTLYMIELKKENFKLSGQIEQLKKENEDMKKDIKALSNQ